MDNYDQEKSKIWDDLQKSVEESRAKYEKAENEKKLIQIKLNRLQEFQKGQYQDLIKEMFEEPTRKAVKKQMFLALGIAVLTIAISLFLAQYSTKTARDAMEIITSNAVDEMENNTLNVFEKYQFESIPIALVVSHIATLNSSKPQIIPKQDNLSEISLLYKLEIVDKYPIFNRSVYLKALSSFVVKNKDKLNEKKLILWESEILSLYRNFLEYVESSTKEIFSLQEREFEQYKDSSDETNYGSWTFFYTTINEGNLEKDRLIKSLEKKIKNLENTLRKSIK